MDKNFLQVLLNSRDETDRLDFKMRNYLWKKGKVPNPEFENKKSELLKDILAFANTRKDESAFIIIGVKHKKDSLNEILGIDHIIDNAELHDFINRKVNSNIDFSFSVEQFGETELGLITIPSQYKNGPFFSTNDYGIVRSNIVYMKNGSSTREVPPSELILNNNHVDETEYDVNILNENDEMINALEFTKLFKFIGEVDYEEPERNRSSLLDDFNPYPVNKNYYKQSGEYYSFNNQSKSFKVRIGSKSHFIKDLDIEIVTNQEEINFDIELKAEPSKNELNISFLPNSLGDKSTFSEGVYRDKIGDKKIEQFYESKLFYVLPQKKGAFDILINTYAVGSPKKSSILKIIFKEDFEEIPISKLKDSL